MVERTGSRDGLDQEKLNYFLAKYKAAAIEDLTDAAGRIDELSDEAATGLRQAVQERGVQISDLAPKANLAPNAGEPDLATQTKMASDLWNGSLSRRIPLQCGFNAIVFSNSLLGSQGLKLGALWLVLLAVALYYPASKAGKRYTRAVCADGTTTIEAKRKSLQMVSYVLWPTLLVAALLGVGLASVIRGS